MTKTAFALSLPTPALRPSKRSLGCRLLGSLSLAGALSVGLFSAAHEIPGFGPWAADALREVVGVKGVARLEDTAYALRDALHQVTRKNEAPKSYWEIPASPPVVTTSLAPLAVTAPVDAPWSPAVTNVPFASVAAAGDGIWVPMNEVGDGSEMKKTLLHPDPGRTWAELFIVAIDLEKVSLSWVPGRADPLNVASGAEALQRPAVIPRAAHAALLAAFNGGFKTQHGNFGAKSEGMTLVPALSRKCTLAQTDSGRLVLGTYRDLEGKDELTWFRQTPECMVEDGKLHPGLLSETSTNWGATLDGGTVIRRSAIGLGEDKRTLYVGISNDTTARALALGMQAAGARTVAQLDVNHAYPKFLLYSETEGQLTARSLASGFAFHEVQYLKPESRDFFYLTRK